MSNPGPFRLDAASIALPTGAYAGGHRDVLTYRDMPIAGFTQGLHRAYLHPVWTPAGVVVTSESPADHPHHNGIWCAADHVAALHPGPDGTERYDYCFYCNDVFQGRAPGTIRALSIEMTALDETTAEIVQALEWTSPREWGAADGRLVLRERRTTRVAVSQTAHCFRMESLLAAGPVPVEIGPTRHAYFNARICDALGLAPDAMPIDDQGRRGAAGIGTRGPKWVDFCGPGPGSEVAGLTVAPDAPDSQAWFVADWGVISVGPFRDSSGLITNGSPMRMSCRFIAHDGPVDRHLAD